MIFCHEILINEFRQNLISLESLIDIFRGLNHDEKKNFLTDLIFLIIQSKPIADDADVAIFNSKMKATYTPAVLLKKGVEANSLRRIIDLPLQESEKAFILLMNLFRISYARRFSIEKNGPNKWWYWDLGDESRKNKLMQIKAHR